MATVHRYGFTRLSGGDTSIDQHNLKLDRQWCLLLVHLLTLHSIIFVHGLRGHPRRTWETAPVTTRKRSRLKSLFQRRGHAASFTSTEEAHASSSPPSSVFWPEQYLAADIPKARVWTYGYNADVIGGLFQANNKNSITQHGRDLSVRLETEINNNVRSRQVFILEQFLNSLVGTDRVRGAQPRGDYCQRRIIFTIPYAD
jgi:hypothetical protein